MAELSSTRANFYKQVYFPATYYGQVFEVTLEDAKDRVKAQQDLQKMLLDSEQTLARLSETFRERALSPSQQLQVQADEKILSEDEKRRAKLEAGRRMLGLQPAAGTTDAIDLALVAERDRQNLPANVPLSAADSERVLAQAVEKFVAGKNPAVQRQIILAAVGAAAERGIGPRGESDALRAVAAKVFKDAKISFGKIREQAVSPEDTAALQKLAAEGGGPLEPEAQAAKARMDALRSPYADGSTEQTGHIASGLTANEDALLRLYLERLQDKDTPGEVTDAEFEQTPELAAAERIYNRVKADNSFQKSAAEWYSSEYLAALRTRENLARRAEKDPFEGMDPYRWAQKEAFERGGYTKESLLELAARRDRPDVAPFVRPAFTRLREDGGLKPKSAAEGVIRAAFEQNPNLTMAELDRLLKDKRTDMIRAGREVELVEGASRGAYRRMHRRTRETASEMFSTPEAAQAAKTYLLALRLQAGGIAPSPDAGRRIELPPPPAPPPRAKDAAGAATNKAAANAKAAAEDSAAVAVPPPLDLTEDAAPASAAPAPAAPAAAPTVEDLEEEVVGRSGFIVDPTNPDYKYRLMPDGNYAVLFKGFAQKPVQKNTRAHQSIASVLAGGKPLARVSPPVVELPPQPMDLLGQASPEQYEAKAATETDPVRKKALTDMAARMRAQGRAPAPASAPAPAPAATPAPTPAAAPTAAAPAPPAKPLAEMTDEELEAYYKSIGGR